MYKLERWLIFGSKGNRLLFHWTWIYSVLMDIYWIQTELVSLLLIVLRPLKVPLRFPHIFFWDYHPKSFLERALKKNTKSRRAGSFREKNTYRHLLKNKTKHTYFVSNAQSHSARVVQESLSVLYKLQKSLPVASTGHGNLSFWVSGFIPTDCLHCSPWKRCLPTAVLSCTLSATIAVMKMGLAMWRL